MDNAIAGMLEAIKGGDSLAVLGLLDRLEESGDDRLEQVKKTWQGRLSDFSAEVGLLWDEYAPNALYPDWRDAVRPAMLSLRELGRYANYSRCPNTHRREVGLLGLEFARALHRLGCCTAVYNDTMGGTTYIEFWFQFRNQRCCCVLRQDEVTWRHRRPRPSAFLSQPREQARMPARQFNQAKVLVRYVITSAETFLAGRAARRKGRRVA